MSLMRASGGLARKRRSQFQIATTMTISRFSNFLPNLAIFWGIICRSTGYVEGGDWVRSPELAMRAG
jgi:hypothetical protein